MVVCCYQDATVLKDEEIQDIMRMVGFASKLLVHDPNASKLKTEFSKYNLKPHIALNKAMQRASKDHNWNILDFLAVYQTKLNDANVSQDL